MWACNKRNIETINQTRQFFVWSFFVVKNYFKEREKVKLWKTKNNHISHAETVYTLILAEKVTEQNLAMEE